MQIQIVFHPREIMLALRVFALLIVAANAHGFIFPPPSIIAGMHAGSLEQEAKERRAAEKQRAAEAAKNAPKRYYYESTLTWDSSEGFCKRFDRVLCSYKELCPDTENQGREFIDHVVGGNHWVAIEDRDWLHIGNLHARTCLSLSTFQWSQEKTIWTRTANSEPWKGYVYCCVDTSSQPEPEPKVVLGYIGGTATYESSKDHCVDEGRRLCTSSEICVDNKPVYGESYGDNWVATSDHDNDWIQIGTENAPICRHHQDYPSWGKRTDKSSRDWVGYVYCCK